jgi:hypothetical protein
MKIPDKKGIAPEGIPVSTGKKKRKDETKAMANPLSKMKIPASSESTKAVVGFSC